MLHTQLGLTPQALDSFPVKALLQAADITMTSHTAQRPHQDVSALLQSGHSGSDHEGMLNFGVFGMLCQSNLAPSSSTHFDPTRHAC